MGDMKTTSALRLRTGDSLTAQRLASAQQTVDPVDKFARGSNNLIRQRRNSGRAGACDEGVVL